MKKIVMLKKIVFVLIISYLPIGCGDTEDVDKTNNTSAQIDGRSRNWSKQNIVDKDGKEYLEVRLKDEVLRLPKEYVAQNASNRVFFDIIPQWPDLLPISSGRELPEYHPIRIRFRSKLADSQPESVYKDSYYALERALANPTICLKLEPSELFHGLLQCGEQTGLSYFQIQDENITTPTGNPVVAFCHTAVSNEEFRRFSCRVGIEWSENLSFQYDLFQYKKDRNLLEEFSKVHFGISRLIQSFYGD